jgi:general secretion pathway protein B
VPPKPKPETVVAKAAVQGASAPALLTPEAGGTKASASRAASADAPLLSELPEDIRRQISPMTINVAVYSDNPGQRVLLVNQQVLTQGSQAVPEVSLEEIRARSSVFSFRGTRFRLAH